MKLLISIFFITLVSNAYDYVCYFKNSKIFFSLHDNIIEMDEGYGNRKGYREGEEYLFGHGTGSLKIIKSNNEITGVIRDDNVDTYMSSECKNTKKMVIKRKSSSSKSNSCGLSWIETVNIKEKCKIDFNLGRIKSLNTCYQEQVQIFLQNKGCKSAKQ